MDDKIAPTPDTYKDEDFKSYSLKELIIKFIQDEL